MIPQLSRFDCFDDIKRLTGCATLARTVSPATTCMLDGLKRRRSTRGLEGTGSLMGGCCFFDRQGTAGPRTSTAILRMRLY